MSGYENEPDYGGPAPTVSEFVWFGLLLVAIFLVALWVRTADAAEFTGRVTQVSDGDTFRIGNTRIRLCGIDAPEIGMEGANAATAALEALIGGKEVRCVQVGSGTVCDHRSKPTNQGRIVAQCFVDGRDVADIMADLGHACDWPRFSGGHYHRSGIPWCP